MGRTAIELREFSPHKVLRENVHSSPLPCKGSNRRNLTVEYKQPDPLVCFAGNSLSSQMIGKWISDNPTNLIHWPLTDTMSL